MDAKQEAIEIHKALESKLVVRESGVDPRYRVTYTEYTINLELGREGAGWYVTDFLDGWVFGHDEQIPASFKDCLDWCLSNSKT